MRRNISNIGIRRVISYFVLLLSLTIACIYIWFDKLGPSLDNLKTLRGEEVVWSILGEIIRNISGALAFLTAICTAGILVYTNHTRAREAVNSEYREQMHWACEKLECKKEKTYEHLFALELIWRYGEDPPRKLSKLDIEINYRIQEAVLGFNAGNGDNSRLNTAIANTIEKIKNQVSSRQRKESRHAFENIMNDIKNRLKQIISKVQKEHPMPVNPHNLPLEPEAVEFIEATSVPPLFYQVSPADSRAGLDEAQSSEIFKPEVDTEWLTIPAGSAGEVSVRIVRPKDTPGDLPVIVYTHGGGWVLGNAHTHDRLVRDLAVGTGASVVFPEYTPAPETRYPVQNEQSYAAAQWVVAEGAKHGLDPKRMVAVGDSAGGNMAIALNLMGQERGDVKFRGTVLFYPVKDASLDTESYNTFAQGYFLDKEDMEWFWDQYASNASQREEITASPLRASEEQVAFFPPTLVITAEADVLRDEGEAFAQKLRRAGVDVTQVRYGGIIHDFMMANMLHDTPQAKAALEQAVHFLKNVLDA